MPHVIINLDEAYLTGSTVTNIYKTFTYKMAAETS